MPVRAMRNPTSTVTCARAANKIPSESSGQSNAQGTTQSLATSIQAKMHVNALATIAATRNVFSSGNRSATIAADVAKSALLRIINPLNKPGQFMPTAILVRYRNNRFNGHKRITAAAVYSRDFGSPTNTANARTPAPAASPPRNPIHREFAKMGESKLGRLDNTKLLLA